METFLLAAVVGIAMFVSAVTQVVTAREIRRLTVDDEEEIAEVTGLGRFRRERLLVSHQDMKVAWRGLLDEELDQGIVLDAVEVVVKGAGGKVDIESMPGKVWIPASNILSVQVLRDE